MRSVFWGLDMTWTQSVGVHYWADCIQPGAQLLEETNKILPETKNLSVRRSE